MPNKKTSKPIASKAGELLNDIDKLERKLCDMNASLSDYIASLQLMKSALRGYQEVISKVIVTLREAESVVGSTLSQREKQ